MAGYVDLRHASSCTYTHTHAHIRTYTLSFRTLQSTSEGGDVILSAAAPAEEASKGGRERETEKRKKQGIEKRKKATGKNS